jgi:coenzyme F420-reducing hydrogenase alpha subunit
MSESKNRSIKVEALARVEGEGALSVKVRNGRVTAATLDIYEPPRFFEAFLRGRRHDEAPDITARICGICPVAYQMSSMQAMEHAFGTAITPGIRALRRLLYCGEWIESHALHVTMLHAPDFLGYASGIHMAADHGDVVRRGLELKRIGNAVVAVVGGREIHPINARVGGFYRAPTRAEIQALRAPLEWAREAAVETVRWVAGFRFPDFESDYEFVALRHPQQYPMNEGRVASTAGLDIAVEDYERHFAEEHVRHSNALHSAIRGHEPYFVGPLARYALNRERLSAAARKAAEDAGLGPVCRNPFKSIVVRAVELVEAAESALAIVSDYQPPDPPAVEVTPRAGRGCGASEAPRGILYHRYALDARGVIEGAKIVPPTSQNQKIIEDDLRRYVEAHLDLDDAALTWGCEQAIRNYDPCISCATHFLKLEIARE